ncbi:MAG: metallophosphoesterase [Verrucomicrobiae bacterium]|nr:metallophosphoesterase [Verrucomicrobiae bacterium]
MKTLTKEKPKIFEIDSSRTGFHLMAWDVKGSRKISPIKLVMWFAAASLVFAVHAEAAAQPIKEMAGCVFEDANRNGKRDEGEKGLGEILVSNGFDTIKTDEKGQYKIFCGGHGVLFISRPSGYLPTSPWYYALEQTGEHASQTADFGLAPIGKDENEFSFGHLGDIHLGPGVASNKATKWFFEQAMPKIKNESAAFFIQTGDVSFDALGKMPLGEKIEKISLFKREMEGMCRAPVYFVFGNHDRSPREYPEMELFKSLAPPWYSFDWGKCHCLVIKNTDYHLEEKQLQWIANDLSAQKKDVPLLVFTHEPIRDDLTKTNKQLWNLVSSRNLVAVFNGHDHKLMVKKRGNTLCVENGSICGDYLWTTRGNTFQPSGYGLVKIAGEKIAELKFKSLESDDPVAILFPQDWQALKNAGGLVYGLWDGRIRACFLDFLGGEKVKKMAYRFDAGPWEPMARNNGLKWLSGYPMGDAEADIPNLWISGQDVRLTTQYQSLKEGLHQLMVQAEIENATWSKTLNFYTGNSAIPSGNLLEDSSFEIATKKNDVPDAWWINPQQTKWSVGAASSGFHSFELLYPAKPGYFCFFRSSRVKIDPSKRYNLSARVKGQNIPPRTQFVFTTGGSFNMSIPPGTYDWMEINGQAFFLPGTDAVSIGLYCQNVSRQDLEAGKNAKIWVDDVELKCLGEKAVAPWSQPGYSSAKGGSGVVSDVFPLQGVSFPAEYARHGKFSIVQGEIGHLMFYFCGDKNKIQSPEMFIEFPPSIKLLSAFNRGSACKFSPINGAPMGTNQYIVSMNENCLKNNLSPKIVGGYGGPASLFMLVEHQARSGGKEEKSLIRWFLRNSGRNGAEKKLPVNVVPPLSSAIPKRTKFYLYDGWLLKCPASEQLNKLLNFYEKLNMRGALTSRFIRKGWECYREPVGGSWGHWGNGYWGISDAKELSNDPQDILIVLRNGKKGMAICQTYLIENSMPGMVYYEKVRKKFADAYFEGLSGFMHNYEMNWKSDISPTNSCFCKRCKDAFAHFSDISIGEINSMTNDEIFEKYKSKWYDFRFWQNAQMQGIFYRAAKSVNPQIKVILASAYLTEKGRDEYPLDIRMCDEFVDEHQPQFYWDGTFCYKVTDLTRRQLKKPVVALLCTCCCPTEKYALGSRNVRMSALAAASSGCQGISYFTGSSSMDGEYFKAIDEAQDVIAKLEDYFLDGKREDSKGKLDEESLKNQKIFLKIFNLNDHYLAVFFNYNATERKVKCRFSLPDGIYDVSDAMSGEIFGKKADVKAEITFSIPPWNVRCVKLEYLKN